MIKGKFLHTTKIKDYKYEGTDVEFSVYGLFETEKSHWTYYVISHLSKPTGMILTPDLCRYEQQATNTTIAGYGKKFAIKEEGIKYIQEFKDKWEYGSNDTRQERRDEKINDVLGNEGI